MKRHARTLLACLCTLGSAGQTPIHADQAAWLVNPAESKPLHPAPKMVVTPEGAAAKNLSVAGGSQQAETPPTNDSISSWLPSVEYVSRRPRIWAHFDLLLWQVTRSPINVPVVTVNDNPNSVGAINESGTRVLVGGPTGKDIDYRCLGGVRIELGTWLDSEGRFGISGSGFRLEPETDGYRASSPGGTMPVIAIPVNATTAFGTNPAGETALNAGGSPSVIRVRSSTDVWGTELNALLVPQPDEPLAWGMLFGGRYLNFGEKFVLSDVFYDTSNTGNIAVRDSYEVRNHFGGVNLGGQAQWSMGRFQASVVGKVALGVVRQNTDIRGETVVNGSAFGMGNASFPGGVFTQANNIGNYTQDRFGVLPEANFRLAFAVTQNLKLSVGYDALFINSVLRAGNQIDRNVNVNQSVLFGNGTSLPARAPGNFNDSSLWMHGVNFGIGLSY